MSFSGSATDIRVEDGFLRCRCQNLDGDLVDAEINLNDIIGNDAGRFSWGGSGFVESSRNVWLEDGRILRAQLGNGEGEWWDHDVNLDERIGNDNGNLFFVS